MRNTSGIPGQRNIKYVSEIGCCGDSSMADNRWNTMCNWRTHSQSPNWPTFPFALLTKSVLKQHVDGQPIV